MHIHHSTSAALPLVTCSICEVAKPDELFRQLHGKRRGTICKACHADRCRDANREHKRIVRADPASLAREHELRRANERQRYATDQQFANEKRARAVATYHKVKAENPAALVEKRKRQGNKPRERTASWRIASKVAGRAASPETLPVLYASPEVRRFYLDCPAGMTVDHIIPLNGETVSGLHVAANLQYLTQAQNSSKWNRFDPIAYEQWVEAGAVRPFIPPRPSDSGN